MSLTVQCSGCGCGGGGGGGVVGCVVPRLADTSAVIQVVHIWIVWVAGWWRGHWDYSYLSAQDTNNNQYIFLDIIL